MKQSERRYEGGLGCGAEYIGLKYAEDAKTKQNRKAGEYVYGWCGGWFL